jgi:leukotriene-A4 hydrolase
MCNALLQDTPNVKMTYDAIVTVAAPLTAVMSAKRVPAAPTLSRFAATLAGDAVAFEFMQDIPIPSYLIALAVGELEARELSARSRVRHP